MSGKRLEGSRCPNWKSYLRIGDEILAICKPSCSMREAEQCPFIKPPVKAFVRNGLNQDAGGSNWGEMKSLKI